MHTDDRIKAFALLGKKIAQLSPEEFEQIALRAKAINGWFSEQSIQQALEGISYMLNEEKLTEWTSNYQLESVSPKVVGVVMAGNIPMVGFHDLLCVLITGHFAAIKLSSSDEVLMRQLIDWLIEIEPRIKKNIEIREKLTDTDAVIATGSDNTARYFEYYFRDIPHIIRKNRTSIAILNGNETPEEIKALGKDIFSYYGLGCRNVSKVFTPKGFELTELFPHFEDFQYVIENHKYRNNYDYYKSIFLVNKTPHLDTGFLLVNTSDDLVSPISVLYHQAYEARETLDQLLASQKTKIQCIVGEEGTPFGQTQLPELWDYADDVDTVKFLLETGG